MLPVNPGVVPSRVLILFPYTSSILKVIFYILFTVFYRMQLILRIYGKCFFIRKDHIHNDLQLPTLTCFLNMYFCKCLWLKFLGICLPHIQHSYSTVLCDLRSVCFSSYSLHSE